MESAESPSARYRFEASVEILAALDTCGIEHLEVSDERTIVIYSRTILNLEVDDGQLDDARTISIEIFDPSPPTSADPETFIESFVAELATTTRVAWNAASHPSDR
jgi:hypothetical protein